MAVPCSAPVRALDAHTIEDAARAIRVQLHLNWGDADIRDDWKGEQVFCSFACLAEWATEMASRHDEHVLVHGPTPEGDES